MQVPVCEAFPRTGAQLLSNGTSGAKLLPTGEAKMLYLQHQNASHRLETRRALHAADGYLYLDMPDEALEELTSISENDQVQPDVMLAHNRVLLHLRR